MSYIGKVPTPVPLTSADLPDGGVTTAKLAASLSLTTPALGTPSSGNFSSGTFTWPTFNQNTTGTAANVTGTVAIANGGTGETTRQAALDALAGAVTSGSYLRGNGTDVVMATIQAADVPTLNQNTTGTAAGLSATLAVASGGTGITSFGAGVATWLGTPSSANLASAVTDETGSGALVFGTAPALSNPTVTSYTETVYALSGTAIDPANGTIQTKTLGANTTFTESLADGQSVVLMVNPVTYTVTWPTMTWINVAGSGSAPTLEASSMNVVVMWQAGGTLYGNWAGSA